MRVLALDLGMKRVGVAISDPMGWTAQPVATLAVTPDHAWAAKVAKLCQEREVEEVLVGIPLDTDGTPGLAAARTRKLAAKLKPHLPKTLPVKEVDERLSSRQAENLMIDADVSRARRKEVLDQLSACVFLQSYLDAKARGR